MAKANLSSLVHELRECIAASSSTLTPNNPSDDALEVRFRTLLHAYVVSSSSSSGNEREVIAVVELISLTARNFPGVFFHGKPSAVLPVLARILPFFADPLFRSRHGVLFEALGFLLSLLRSGARDAYRHFLSDSMLLIQDLGLSDEAEEIRAEAAIFMPVMVLCSGLDVSSPIFKRMEYLKGDNDTVKKYLPSLVLTAMPSIATLSLVPFNKVLIVCESQALNENRDIAKTLLLYSRWTQYTAQKQKEDVISLYTRMRELQPEWENIYFYMAKYCDEVLGVAKKCHQESFELGPRQATVVVGSSNLNNERRWWSYEGLHMGHKNLFQALPTLWFDFGSMYIRTGSSNKDLKNVHLKGYYCNQTSVRRTSMTLSKGVKNVNQQKHGPQITKVRKRESKTSKKPSNQRSPRKKALLIGIMYTDSYVEEGQLTFSLKTIEILAVILSLFFNFDKRNIKLLCDVNGKDEYKKPTSKKIIDEVRMLVETSQAGDVLYIHISGHGRDGIEDNDGKAYFVSCEGDIVSELLWEEVIQNIPFGVRLTISLDCCKAAAQCRAALNRAPKRGQVSIIAVNDVDQLGIDGLFYDRILVGPETPFKNSKGKTLREVEEIWHNAVIDHNYTFEDGSQPNQPHPNLIVFAPSDAKLTEFFESELQEMH